MFPGINLSLIPFFWCKVSSLDDVKTNSQTDSNAAKQMALDHLGVIAAKIRTSVLKFQRENNQNPATRFLKPLDEVRDYFIHLFGLTLTTLSSR